MAQRKEQAPQPQPQPQTKAEDGLWFLTESNVIPLTSDAAERIRAREEAAKAVESAEKAFKSAETTDARKTDLMASAALSLYNAIEIGAMTIDDMKATLGKVVGYEPKKDGSPGASLRKKTAGRPIEQRVRRAVMVQKHLRGETVYGFARERPADDMRTIMAAVEGGTESLWTAYDRLGKLKERGSINKAFDPKVIAAIADSLGQDGAAATLLGSDALRLAYGRLVSNLKAIGAKA